MKREYFSLLWWFFVLQGELLVVGKGVPKGLVELFVRGYPDFPSPFLPAAQHSHSHKAGMEQPEGSSSFPSHQRVRDVSLHSDSVLTEDTPKKGDPTTANCTCLALSVCITPQTSKSELLPCHRGGNEGETRQEKTCAKQEAAVL